MSKRKEKGLFGYIERFTQVDSIENSAVHIKLLPYVSLLLVLGVFYIGNRHYVEKKTREITRLEKEIEDLRADYITLKSTFEFNRKQSEIIKKAEKLGLKESKTPPTLIQIKK